MLLTVQPTGNGKFRLSMGLQDSFQFQYRGRQVLIVLNDRQITTKTTCGPPLDKGFDLYHTEINDWIIQNRYQLYPFRNPTKIEFGIQVNQVQIILTFINVIN
jgi:hypothetical protein